MDNLTIGENIFSLRKKKNLTQSDLAEILGVSSGAVSKWETGNTAPDISLLVPIAKTLNTSIDALLSYKAFLAPEEILHLQNKLTDLFLFDQFEHGKKKSLEILEEFPNNLQLKMMVANLIYTHSITADHPDSNFLEEHIKLALSIYLEVVRSGDKKYTPMALPYVAHLQMLLGEEQITKDNIKMIPSLSADTTETCHALLLDKRNLVQSRKTCHRGLYQHLQHITSILMTLSKIEEEDENYNQSLFYIDTINKLQEHFQFGLHSASYSFCLSYIKQGEIELAAKWFHTYVGQLLNTSYTLDKNQFYIEFITELGGDNRIETKRNILKKLLTDPNIKPIQETSLYKESMEAIKEYLQI